jgi:hypothetical protein
LHVFADDVYKHEALEHRFRRLRCRERMCTQCAFRERNHGTWTRPFGATKFGYWSIVGLKKHMQCTQKQLQPGFRP